MSGGSEWGPVLARYVEVLAASLDSTGTAGDRALYKNHLAAAAHLVPVLAASDQIGISNWIASEEHAWGWSYLSGGEGEAAEQAFVELRAILERSA